MSCNRVCLAAVLSVLLVAAVATGAVVSPATAQSDGALSGLGIEIEQEETVQQGGDVTVTGYPWNQGDQPITGVVTELRIDADADGTFEADEAFASRTVDYAAEGSEVDFTVSDVQLAAGSYEYRIHAEKDGDVVYSYTNGSLTVESGVGSTNPFPNGVPGVSSSPPTDPDGDGRYEDVNGDGSGDALDPESLEAMFNGTDVSTFDADQTAALDFNGDGTVGIADVSALESELGASSGGSTGDSNVTVVTVSNASVVANSSAAVDVVAEEVPDGVSVYELTVTLADGSVADVGEVTDAPSGTLSNVNRTGPHSVTVSTAAAGIDPGSGPVTLATVTLTNTSAGTTEVGAAFRASDASGSEVPTSVRNGTLEVGSAGVPPSPPEGNTTVKLRLDSAPYGIRLMNVSVAANGSTIVSPPSAPALGSVPVRDAAIERGGVDATNVTVRTVSTGSTVSTDAVTLLNLSFAGTVNESDLTYTVTTLTNTNGSGTGDPIDPARVSLDVTQPDPEPTVFSGPAPGISGAEGAPNDVDGDGKFEDVNGDGETDFSDVLDFAFSLSSTDRLTAEQKAAFNFDGDSSGDISFGDVISLAFNLGS